MSLLSAIIEQKRREVASLPSSIAMERKPLDLVDRMLRRFPALIAEIKPKSPSQGFLLERSDMRSIVTAYNTYADAISVLCDHAFFGGGYDLLSEVRSMTDKPILAKEFIIDAKQIRYAAVQGADAVLLIASILQTDTLIAFLTEASSLGLGCLLEVHSERDVRKAATAYEAVPQYVQRQILIGINNRSLDTLEIDLSITERLAPMIKNAIPSVRGIIAESGISTPEDAHRLQPFVQGFLIGTSILRSENPTHFLGSLLSTTPKVKFCGMTNDADIAAAEKLHIDFIGFIFVSSSPRHISLERAQELRRSVQHAKTIGVFMDMSIEDMERHISALDLAYVQMHGTPNAKLCRALSVPVIQAFRGVPTVETLEKFLAVGPYILIDKEDGKDEADFAAIAALPQHIRSRLFLAGGLTPLNVEEAIHTIHPFAVDCARGIESAPGKKDETLMESFLSHLSS
jgi:indole-3-glycerol phosphate synthase/phosphoribosylanthranilate isomerase